MPEAAEDVGEALLVPAAIAGVGISLERAVAQRFVKRLVATDLPTALVKVKLLRAIRDFDRDELAPSGDTGRPARAA